MREYFRNFGSGFFWGAGFITASLIVISMHTIFVERQILRLADDMYEAQSLKRLTEQWRENFDVETLNLYKLERQLRITASINNNSGNPSFLPNINFDIFNEDGNFISKCKYFSDRSGAHLNEPIYVEATCNVSVLQAEQASYAIGYFSL
ncbi:hypothetical protein [Aliidiomarina indica]|uniref:hypothetical protein n=1 Tax=Aliidiomarina indica TaxID=2749147 RepID=UPI00188E8FDA|nr:hypothetical protein [Aliidiomarina indica]